MANFWGVRRVCGEFRTGLNAQAENVQLKVGCGVRFREDPPDVLLDGVVFQSQFFFFSVVVES